MPRPLILDLFCGAGGAGMGYFLAGWDVIGIDKHPQPNYPFRFIQADLASPKTWARIPWHKVTAVHASPPCQRHTSLGFARGTHNNHPNAIPPTRAYLQASGKPYVIENVPGSPLLDPVTLCGSMFNLHTRHYELKRHRNFELNWNLPASPAHSCGTRRAVTVAGDGGSYRPIHNGWRKSGQGVKEARPPKPLCRQLMGIHWMEWPELVQAIPPVYTQYLGWHLRQQL